MLHKQICPMCGTNVTVHLKGGEKPVIMLYCQWEAIQPFIQHVGNCGASGSENPLDERCICGLRQAYQAFNYLEDV